MHRPILVVEDDNDIRDTLRAVLEQEGWEFVQNLYAATPTPVVPVCVVSAFADRAPPEARAVLRKPIELDALLRVVEEHC